MPSATDPATLFLSTQDIAEVVRRTGLSACLSQVAKRIEADFLRWQMFDKSSRLASHSSHGVIELMPISDVSEFTFKYVNGHPSNTVHGLPTVMAFGVLADVETGMPRLLSELTIATAIRTAAMSALAAKVLARHDSKCMAIIGNGAQSEFQVIAFRDLLGIRKFRLFDVDAAASHKLIKNLADQGIELSLCNSTSEAVSGSDIVTTATADKSRAVIIEPGMIRPGMHLNAIGGDCPGKTELHEEVVRGANVFVEYEQQTRIEGEIQQLPQSFAVTEFWQVLKGTAVGRRSPKEVTLFDSVGFALEDFSTLGFFRERASALGIGRTIDLIANADDPKDLFGLLLSSGS